MEGREGKRRTRRLAMLRGMVPAALGALLVVPGGAAAQDARAGWTCASSAVRVELGGEVLAEPVSANRGAERCADGAASTPRIDQGSGGLVGPSLPAVRVTLEGVYAETDLAGDGGATFAQIARSRAGAASARVEVGDGGPVIEVDGLASRATASCLAGAPVLSGGFDAATIRVDGEELSLDEALGAIAAGLSEAGLDQLVKIEIGKRVASGDAAATDQSLVVRALEVQLLGAPEPAARLVVGESAVDRHGAACAPPPCPPGTVPSSQGQCVLTIHPPCPEGSTQNGQGQCVVPGTCPPGSTANEQGQCVVPAGPDGQCPEGSSPNGQGACIVDTGPTSCPGNAILTPERVCVLVVVPPCPSGSVDNGQGHCVLPPSGLPTGGRVVPPEAVPASLNRRCRVGAFGSQVAILGTRRGDRITGTNRSDRIFGLSGRDRISGGRGNDCLDGGSDGDNLDASNGSDLLLGGRGRDILNGGVGTDLLRGESGDDKLTGGSGSDRLYGQAGRDRLSGGFGRDRLFGGAGNDYIDGGNGADLLSGGAGNDAINAATAGRGRDVVRCGRGRDVVRMNRRDRVASDCERVHVTRRRR